MKSQFVALLASRLTAAALQAVTFILFARAAGVADVGTIGVVVGVGIVLATLADLGIAPLIARARARGEAGKVRAGLRINIISTVIFGLIFSAVTWIIFNPERPAVAVGAALVALALAVEKNSDTLLSLAYADGAKWVPAASLLSRRTTSLAIMLVALGAPAGIEPVVAYGISQLGGSVVGQVATRFALRRSLPTKENPADSTVAVLRESAPYLVNGLSAQARNLDVPVVAMVGGATAAGYYSAALRLVNPLMLVPASLTSLLLPHVSKMSASSTHRITRNLVFASASLYVVIVPAALLAPTIVNVVLGEDFAPAAQALAIMLLSLPAIGMSSPLASIVQARERASMAAIISASTAVVALVGVAIGTMLAGATGAAIATGVVFAIKCVALLLAIHFQEEDGEPNARPEPTVA